MDGVHAGGPRTADEEMAVPEGQVYGGEPCGTEVGDAMIHRHGPPFPVTRYAAHITRSVRSRGNRSCSALEDVVGGGA